MRLRLTQHHLVPRSRGGANAVGNIRHITGAQHQAWHTLFGNRTPEEVIAYVAVAWTPEQYFSEKTLRFLEDLKKDG